MLITGLTSSWNKAVSPIITLAMNFHVITRVGDLEHALVFGMDHFQDGRQQLFDSMTNVYGAGPQSPAAPRAF